MDESRVIIVTGGNAGIGRAVAEQLALQQHHVVIVSRNREKGETAVAEIKQATGNQNVDLVQGDLSSIANVKKLAADLLERYPRIHVLINNAGVWMTERQLNDDGLEMTFMVNHVAPYILSLQLLDRLKESAPARIVMVNAGLYVNGTCDLDQLPTGENFNRFKTYMHSKLCNVMVTLELAKQLEGTGVTVNALHPGVINTNLGSGRGPLGVILKLVKKLWGKPEEGAAPIVRLAIDPSLETTNGHYYDIDKEHEITQNARDEALNQKLWTYTQELTNVP